MQANANGSLIDWTFSNNPSVKSAFIANLEVWIPCFVFFEQSGCLACMLSQQTTKFLGDKGRMYCIKQRQSYVHER